MLSTKTEQLMNDLIDVVMYDDNASIIAVESTRNNFAKVEKSGTPIQQIALVSSIICLIADELGAKPYQVANKIYKILKKYKKDDLLEKLETSKEEGE